MADERYTRLLAMLDRERACITAMQRRAARNPLRDFLWRRPWRSPGGVPGLIESVRRAKTPGVAVRNAWGWIAAAHDCADPAVACSCTGGFRFP